MRSLDDGPTDQQACSQRKGDIYYCSLKTDLKSDEEMIKLKYSITTFICQTMNMFPAWAVEACGKNL